PAELGRPEVPHRAVPARQIDGVVIRHAHLGERQGAVEPVHELFVAVAVGDVAAQSAVVAHFGDHQALRIERHPPARWACDLALESVFFDGVQEVGELAEPQPGPEPHTFILIDIGDDDENFAGSIHDCSPGYAERRYPRAEKPWAFGRFLGNYPRVRGIAVQPARGPEAMSDAATPASEDYEKRATLAALASAGSVEATLSSIPDFVYAFDADRRFAYANPALLALFGLSASPAIPASAAGSKRNCGRTRLAFARRPSLSGSASIHGIRRPARWNGTLGCARCGAFRPMPRSTWTSSKAVFIPTICRASATPSPPAPIRPATGSTTSNIG